MFKRLFSRQPRSLPETLRNEVLSICRAGQVDQLALSPHLRRDIGMDCGCIDTWPHR